MAKKENIEAVDVLLRDLCSPSIPFGGKVIVFGGDFRQVLPIVPRKSQSEAIEASLVSSTLWNQFHRFRLTDNMGVRTDYQFVDFLLAMGNGQMQNTEIAHIQLPQHVMMPFDESKDAINGHIGFVFPEVKMANCNESMFVDRAILNPLNTVVDDINCSLIDQFPGEYVCYKSYDLFLDDTRSLCNGTRMLCKHFYPNIIECAIITGHHAGEHVFVPQIDLRPYETLYVGLSRAQTSAQIKVLSKPMTDQV
ncbi:uncharacterized protein LOC110739323 [Chenopodium quinoa]|uniref:uncharacterized protein LOC110739323 n=1 Tax=Chenopodium quinoa TaxID=63459 RepID=UPI000B78A20B|nr:uncharacterized protein LOC110739323 [Chenopodium quinoa]